ncbi:hypothetical protein BOX15_Mlig016479g1 [Macrostomum lignano]|uniref:Tetraspanin n=1 Tax=Macrostomum lignano TaxID=282301 RepID=A0A267GQJ3_9PLAT|nr:hypothetical protein BOX15_Mlig016479g1 [Macrostomum lignano]
MGSGCLTCCRWCCCCFISFVNVLTAILGLALLATGCLTLWAYWVVRSAFDQHVSSMLTTTDNIETSVDVESLHQAMASNTMISAIVFIILGVLIIVMSCLGCCGACWGVPSCLIIYSVLVALVLLSQAGLVIFWFTNSDVMKDCSRNWLEEQVKNYKGSQNRDVGSMQLDVVQVVGGCCGVNNGNDFYTMATNWNRTIGYRSNNKTKFSYYNASYPFSCCNYYLERQDFKCAYANLSDPYSNRQNGCYEKFASVFDNYLKSGFDRLFFGVAGWLGVEILLLLGALLIFYHKRQQDEDIPHSGVQYKMQPQMA